MATITRLGRTALRLNNVLFRPRVLRIATISTSKKNKDTITISDAVVDHGKTKTEEATVETKKNWISWGFSYESEVKDNTLMHLTFFFGVTLCLVTTGFVWTYLPDFRYGVSALTHALLTKFLIITWDVIGMMDWAQREGYLELRRREELGLPLIDPNLIPVDKIEMPDDEELGNTEIII